VDGELKELLRRKADGVQPNPKMPGHVLKRARRRRIGTVLLSTAVVAALGVGVFLGASAALKKQAIRPPNVPATHTPGPRPAFGQHFFGIWPVDSEARAQAFAKHVKAGHDLWALEPNTEAVYFATHVMHWPRQSVAVHRSTDMGTAASTTIWNRDMSTRYSPRVALNFSFGSPTAFPSVWVIERVDSGVLDLQCPSIRQDVLVTGLSQEICGSFSQAPAGSTVKATLSPAGHALQASGDQHTADIPVSGSRFDGTMPVPDFGGDDAALLVTAYARTGVPLGLWVRRFRTAPASLASPGATTASPTLTLSPTSGPIGTVVTLQGANCFSSSTQQEVQIEALRSLSHGGAGMLVVRRSASASSFTVRYRIPATMRPYAGGGGGSIRSGDEIVFVTMPNAVCTSTAFTVTP